MNKLGLYMNSLYWGKTVIKLLNIINNVDNFSNISSKNENSGIKTSTLAREYINTQGTLAREHVSEQDTWAREHVNLQGTLVRKHAMHVST